MSGNEIILNLENHDNFTTSELIGGLIELGKRDKNYKFNFSKYGLNFEKLKFSNNMKVILKYIKTSVKCQPNAMYEPRGMYPTIRR